MSPARIVTAAGRLVGIAVFGWKLWEAWRLPWECEGGRVAGAAVPGGRRKMSLFALGKFKLHSGDESRWKICCEALDADDWAALAVMLAERLPPFAAVVGVPRGGLALADQLRQHASALGRCVLVVDDVLTTGRSMGEVRGRLLAAGNEHVRGAVVFARGPCPDWVTPLFQMSPGPAEGA